MRCKKVAIKVFKQVGDPFISIFGKHPGNSDDNDLNRHRMRRAVKTLLPEADKGLNFSCARGIRGEM